MGVGGIGAGSGSVCGGFQEHSRDVSVYHARQGRDDGDWTSDGSEEVEIPPSLECLFE